MHHATARHRTGGGVLDWRLGLRLLRDRRIPAIAKALAVGLGIVFTSWLVAAEFPVEAILGILVPGFGLMFDFLLDGVEFFVLPAMFCGLLLPFLSPKDLIDRIRLERSGTLIPNRL